MVRAYYELAKPGIVYGNALTTLAAFLYASRWDSAWLVFLPTMVGIMLVIASACVCNNYFDRDIDAKMARTKSRALVTGAISVTSALTYALVLGVTGIGLIFFYVNGLTAAVALFGFLMYVVAYGYAKRAGSWGTLVGSIPGAVPIVVGYTAVVGQIDLAAILLYVSLALWQMPHFYAIALYRREEYAAAGIPVLPIRRGIQRTRRSILAYITAFTILASLLTLFGRAGYTYLAVILVFGIAWFTRASTGFKSADEAAWGKRVFLFSLVVLLAFCFALATAPFLP
jgi:protoheme IX farnesyltransferase